MKRGDLKHLFGCLLIALIAGLVLAFTWHNPWVVPVAGLFAFGCGVLWETIQKFTGKQFSGRDLMFDFIGALCGVNILVITLALFEV